MKVESKLNRTESHICNMEKYLKILGIAHILNILNAAIHKHRVLWGTDSDDEPLMLRDDIKRRMQAAGYTQELIDDQLESAVWTWRFIHDRVKLATGTNHSWSGLRRLP